MKQLRFISLSAIRKTFSYLFLALVVILMLLPFVTTFNELLTRIVENSLLYKPIQKYVVPWEARWVVVTLKLIGIEGRVIEGNKLASMYLVKNGQALPVDLAWNCLGWQSLLLLVVSLVAGLSGRYSNFSRAKCIVFGFLGTVIVNILRMTVVAMGIYYANPIMVAILHDYLVAFVTLVWLIVFWWVSYAFILQNNN